MIISYTDRNRAINLRWRDENGDRQEKSITDFQPYFYIRKTDPRPKTYKAKVPVTVGNITKNVKIDYPFKYEEGDWVDLEKRTLTRVYVGKPGDVPQARKTWNKTYEADVPFIYRYCVDNLKEIPEYEMHKWYWDMEWLNNDPEHGDAITVIVFYCNQDKRYYLLTWWPEGHKAEFNCRKDTVYLEYDSEAEMLESFMGMVDDGDPDMLLAWFGSKFDLPKLIERMHFNGIDPRGLSPYNDVKGVYENRGNVEISDKEYSPVEQPIRGRITLNLDLAFERQWNDAQRGTLPSLALDYVGEVALGQKKLVSDKFPDKNEFFRRGWLEDTQRYLDYAVTDVEIIRRLDEENFTSEAILALQRLLAAPFDACFYASTMGSIYFMKNAWWKAPTGIKMVTCKHCKKTVRIKKKCEKCNKPLGDQYEGAMIYEPGKEGTSGLHLNVAAFDFAGLYPSMMISRNISWETKSDEPTEFAVNVATPRDFSEVKKKEMFYYKTNRLGLLPRSVLELKELRDEYKKRMKAAETKEEYAKWFNNQMAVKRLSASFYGIIGYRGFGWYDLDMAASITASAREAIRAAAFKVREMNG